jgi:hypothetical protein
MNEKQLRNRSVTIGKETRLKSIETDKNVSNMETEIAGEIATGKEISYQTGEELVLENNRQSSGVQRDNESNEVEMVISPLQLKQFMEMMTKSHNDHAKLVKDLNDKIESGLSRIQSDHAKLVKDIKDTIESGRSRLISLIESNSRQFSDELNGKGSKEGERFKGESNLKVEGEIKLIRDEILQIRADTATENLSMGDSLNNTYESLEGKVNSHRTETKKQLGRVNEEPCAKTKVVEIELRQQAEFHDKAIKDVKQNVHQNQVECEKQWITAKEADQATNVKLQREKDNVKENVARKETSVLIDNNKPNDKLSTMPVVANDQVALSQISTENSQGEMPTSQIVEHTRRCNSTTQDDVNSIRLSESSNTVNHGSLAIGNPLNELILPSFENHATQVVGTFLRDLNLYFELKGIPKTLNLPLVSKAIPDPFTKT